MPKKPMKKLTPGVEVAAFLERHGLDQSEGDRLLGSASEGRTTRRWKAEGAPRYVAIMIAYADAFGIDLMRQMADELDAEMG